MQNIQALSRCYNRVRLYLYEHFKGLSYSQLQICQVEDSSQQRSHQHAINRHTVHLTGMWFKRFSVTMMVTGRTG